MIRWKVYASFEYPGEWYAYCSMREWKYFPTWREAMDYVIKDLSL